MAEKPKGSTRRIASTIPLTQAARKLKCSYATAYDYFLRGRIKGWYRGSRIAVTVRSVDALRTEMGLDD